VQLPHFGSKGSEEDLGGNSFAKIPENMLRSEHCNHYRFVFLAVTFTRLEIADGAVR